MKRDAPTLTFRVGLDIELRATKTGLLPFLPPWVFYELAHYLSKKQCLFLRHHSV
jgi:hypothetical protein